MPCLCIQERNKLLSLLTNKDLFLPVTLRTTENCYPLRSISTKAFKSYSLHFSKCIKNRRTIVSSLDQLLNKVEFGDFLYSGSGTALILIFFETGLAMWLRMAMELTEILLTLSPAFGDF